MRHELHAGGSYRVVREPHTVENMKTFQNGKRDVEHLGVVVPRELKRELRKLAVEADTNLSDYVRALLAEHLERVRKAA